jgi:hypothetical protein
MMVETMADETMAETMNATLTQLKQCFDRALVTAFGPELAGTDAL